MNQEDKYKVLGYVDKFSGVFNDMMQEVTKRIVSNQADTDLSQFLQSDFKGKDIANAVKVNPEKFVQHQLAFLEKQQQLWQNASKAFMGEEFEAVIREDKGDKRFCDEDWEGNPGFNYIKQAYLVNAEYMRELVNVLEFEDKSTEELVRFYTRQFINSISPSNYVLTNPEVCREILDTQGENLAVGIDNFMRDLERSPDEAFKITQVKKDAFELGKDLAITAGKVIYENELIQLIHYSPKAELNYKIPLLIIPPFINKYYILDLNEKKSLVNWLLQKGYSVFMVSWVNPDDSLRELSFDEYISKGVIAAIDVVEKISSSKKINMAGYCVGGTILGIAQAYLKSQGDERIESLSFFTTLFDFSEPGEVGTYLSQQLIPWVEKSVVSRGYMDGRVLGLSFSLLRENNLFWSFFIEHYLKGKDPMPFDILYWNSDSTNLPAKAFLYYLNNMYLDNKLIEKDQVSIHDVSIDLSKVDVPCYCLAAQADHIVLWQAAYKSAKCLGGDVRFVLTESGHVAGVVNPADKGKYPHWVNASLTDDASEWFENANQIQGSWWGDWESWLKDRSGEQRKALQVGKKKQYPPIEDAPGRYVKHRLDEV